MLEPTPGRLPEVELTVAGTPKGAEPRFGPPKRRRSGSFVISRSLPDRAVRWLELAMMVKLKSSDFHPPPAQASVSLVPLAHRSPTPPSAPANSERSTSCATRARAWPPGHH